MPKVLTPIEQAQRRAQEYWGIDGLPSLVRGLQALCFFASVYWTVYTPRPAVAWVLFVLPIFLDRSVILFLKRRITFPRTGYVALPPAFRAAVDEPVLLHLNDSDVPLQTPQAGPRVTPLALMVLMVALATLTVRLGGRRIGFFLLLLGVYWTLAGTVKLAGYLLKNRRPRP